MSLDFQHARHLMVEQQVRPAEVLDRRVLDAMMRVPREDFVPPAHRKLAFTDTALPIGYGEHMLKPVIEGRLIQALDLGPTDEALLVGTGTGYCTALLSGLARSVHSIDIHGDFVAAARQRLQLMGLTNVQFETADALHWQAPHAFDAILVTAAVADRPERFGGWLKPGGRLVVVSGVSPVQEALCLRENGGVLARESLFETDISYLRGAEPAPRFAL